MRCPTCNGKGEVEKMPRTASQNNALWLFCDKVAKSLDEAGYTVNMVMKARTVEIPWNKSLVMELVWRPVQQVVLGKKSTRELEKQKDIDTVYEVVNRHLGEKLFIHVPWPSAESEEARALGYLPN